MRCTSAAGRFMSMEASSPEPAGWRLREGERRRLLILGDLPASALAVFTALVPVHQPPRLRDQAKSRRCLELAHHILRLGAAA